MINYFVRPLQAIYSFIHSLRLAWSWQHLLCPGWHRGTRRSSIPSHLISSEAGWAWKRRGHHGGSAEPGQRWVTVQPQQLFQHQTHKRCPSVTLSVVTALQCYLFDSEVHERIHKHEDATTPPVGIWVLPSVYHLYSFKSGVLTPSCKLPFCGQNPISLTYLHRSLFQPVSLSLRALL